MPPAAPGLSGLDADALAQPARLRAAIGAACRRDERSAVAALMAGVPLQVRNPPSAQALARRLVQAVREKRRHGSGVDALMHAFSLSSEEGVALMCVAEALLRIPDAATADRLIADKIGNGDWERHLGRSPSPFVNAAAWGLLITGKLVAARSEQGLAAAATRMLAKGGEPLIRKGMDLAMRMLGRQFVAGQTIEEALRHSRAQERRGYRHSYDMLGEAALTAQDVERYYAAYAQAIHAIGRASDGRGIHAGPGISVKLSALHPRYVRAQRRRVMDELLPRLKDLLTLARHYAIGLNIDAEEADRLELSLDLLEALAFDPDLRGFDGIGFVVQAYQKRCPQVIDYLADLARRSGHRLMLRLVKGAYWDAEIKRAQVEGLPDYPVFTRKTHTDVCYLACARKLLGLGQYIYPQFATHNAHTLATIHAWAQDMGVDDLEFQCLHGMGEALYDEVVGAERLGRVCRIYAPVGSHQTLLAYLVRRLLENGANSSFVNQIVDENLDVATLVADPFARAEQGGGAPHPRIPLPPDLYRERANSQGLDLNDETALRGLGAAFARFGGQRWQTGPLLAGAVHACAAQDITNPADRRDVVGQVVEADGTDVETALAAAEAYALSWQTTPAAMRAALLERAAELLEQQRDELLALAVREAGKSLPNAVGEVREAVDFLRYYAARIRQMPDAQPLGPVVCISPWNFPLAIFVGQISAALAAGNVVLAKPAEQTPLIARRAVELLHEAGIPQPALQYLPGRGERVGAQLVADARVRGVIFTGSTEVAQQIHRTLCARRATEGRDIALIAETGGQNAMIVDSSALPEQVVQDALNSAFDSAGQRCSALRVLCLQEEIAGRTIAMLKGAMRELRIGHPGRLATDVGPVIDADARQNLLRHVARMRERARAVFQLELPPECAHGSFVAPTLVEIDSLELLQGEVFGPVLHVLRYRRDELPRLVDAINATGYGLTLGVHSRIDETIDFVRRRARVGNMYVNRNIIGAVVGVQPFGGEGKSGTGPKAGGPLYLLRLLYGVPFDGGIAAPSRKGPAALQALLRWLREHGDERLAMRVEGYARAGLTETTLVLPGPTGERNTLAFGPRGTILCAASTRASLLNQLAACLATGNSIAIAAGSTALLPADLPEAVHGRLRILDEGCLTAGEVQLALVDPGQLPAVLPVLARLDGPLVIAVESDPDAPLPLWRLVAERALCVNAAAAGGNAGLMALGD